MLPGMKSRRALSLLVTTGSLLVGAVACGSDADDDASGRGSEELATRQVDRDARDRDQEQEREEPKRTTTTVKGTRTSIGLKDLDQTTTTAAPSTTSTTQPPTTTTAPVTTTTAGYNGFGLAVLLADSAAIDQWSVWMDDVNAQMDEVVFSANAGDVGGVLVACAVGAGLAANLPPQIQSDYDLNNYLRQAAAATVALFNSCTNLDLLAMNQAVISVQAAFLNAVTRAAIVAAQLPVA